MIWKLFWSIRELHGLWIKICVCLHTYVYFIRQCLFISGNHYPWVIDLTWWWAQKGVQHNTQPQKVFSAGEKQCPCWRLTWPRTPVCPSAALGPQGKPPHGSLCVPLSEWVWVRGKPTWQQGKDILREDFQVVKSQNKTKNTIQYLHHPAVKACLLKGV